MNWLFIILGAFVQSVVSSLTDGAKSDGAELANGLFLVVCIILTGIGVVKDIWESRKDGIVEILKSIAIDAGIWITAFLIGKILVPVAIFIVVIFVVDHIFLGAFIRHKISDKLFGGKDYWPRTLYDDYGGVYELTEDYYDTAIYVCKDKNIEVHVDRDSLGDGIISTDIGDLHW